MQRIYLHGGEHAWSYVNILPTQHKMQSLKKFAIQEKKSYYRVYLNEDLMLLNGNESTHYHIQTDSYTTINFSFVSSDCYFDFNYKTLSSLHESDHYPISIDKIIICFG